MGRWLTIVLLFCCVTLSVAQKRFIPSMPPNDAAKFEGPVYGMKGGVNFPWLSFTNPQLGQLSPDFLKKKTFSAFYEVPLYGNTTIAAELTFQQRGGSFTYRYSNLFDEKYSMDVTYLSMRIPFCCYFPITDRVKPYLYLAGDVGFPIMGNISLTHPNSNYPAGIPQNQTIDINPYNINILYAGAVGGAGVRWNIPLSLITLVLKAEVAMNVGLTDTFSKYEHLSSSHPTNLQSYSIQGHRYTRGIELNVGIGFYFNKYNACSTFQ